MPLEISPCLVLPSRIALWLPLEHHFFQFLSASLLRINFESSVRTFAMEFFRNCCGIAFKITSKWSSKNVSMGFQKPSMGFLRHSSFNSFKIPYEDSFRKSPSDFSSESDAFRKSKVQNSFGNFSTHFSRKPFTDSFMNYSKVFLRNSFRDSIKNFPEDFFRNPLWDIFIFFSKIPSRYLLWIAFTIAPWIFQMVSFRNSHENFPRNFSRIFFLFFKVLLGLLQILF